MERINTAAARALNALPAEEAAQFDAAAETDRYLSDHLDSFRRVATQLTSGLPEIVPVASPEIWERIVTETGIGTEDKPNNRDETVVPIRKRTLPTLLAIVSVAAALFVGVAIGDIAGNTTPSMRDVAAAAAAEPGATTVVMTSPVGATGINAEVVVTSNGTGYLLGESLPALTDERTYQLWLIVDDQIVSAGLLGNDPDVVQFRAEGNIVGMAISNETAGGVAVSEAEPTALWLQDA